MNHSLTMQQTLLLNASPQTVWNALTNPQIIKQYLFGTETVTDWLPGSQIIFQGEYQGYQYKDKGVIQQIEPLQLLQYTYWSSFSGIPDLPENYSLVTYRLEPQPGNTTLLTLTQQGFTTPETLEHSQKNWAMVLGVMKDIVEAM